MKGHNLKHAIARANRIFEGKPTGLIVDCIRISNSLAEASKKYTSGGEARKPAFDIDDAVGASFSQLALVKEMTGGFELSDVQSRSESENMVWSRSVVKIGRASCRERV